MKPNPSKTTSDRVASAQFLVSTRSGASPDRTASVSSWRTTQTPQSGEVAVVMLAQLKQRSLPWGYGRFALNHVTFRSMAGLTFAKMLGSGHEGGFGLRPSFDRQALFLVFENDRLAKEALQHHLINQYRESSLEFFTVLLDPYACKGSWSGTQLTPTQPIPAAESPIAALTRASIRTSQLAAFWQDAKPAHADMDRAKGCLLAAGVGELPVVRQATFTLWENLEAMNQYARTGAHQTAIARSHQRDYFTESMFVRFCAREAQGNYKGRRYG